MSKGKIDGRSGIEQPISKFEQDISKGEGSLTEAADKGLYGENKTEYMSHVRDIDQELQEDERAIQKRPRQHRNQDVNDALEEMKQAGEKEEQDKIAAAGSKGNKDGEYRMQHNIIGCSPERLDPFESGANDQKPNARSYYVRGRQEEVGRDGGTEGGE